MWCASRRPPLGVRLFLSMRRDARAAELFFSHYSKRAAPLPGPTMSSAFTSEEEELVRSAEAQIVRLEAARAAADQAGTGLYEQLRNRFAGAAPADLRRAWDGFYDIGLRGTYDSQKDSIMM